MKINYQTIHQGDEPCDGGIHFEMGGYVYMIGEDEDVIYIERQLMDDNDNNRDNWEQPEWVSSKNVPLRFKFLKNNK